jgi:hypothetical protein
MKLSKPLSDLLAPLFQALPIENAMPELVPSKPRSQNLCEIVAKLNTDPLIQSNCLLQAGLWLYVDQLDRSHEVSQSIESSAGSLWHGIMHRREGDFWNSKYWFRKAGTTNVLASRNPAGFVDQVEQTYKNNPPELLEYQRQEWQILFEWSAQETAQ